MPVESTKSVKFHSCTIRIPRPIPATTPTEKLKASHSYAMSLQEIICVPLARELVGSGRPWGKQKKDDSDSSFSAFTSPRAIGQEFLTGNPERRARSSLRRLFFPVTARFNSKPLSPGFGGTRPTYFHIDYITTDAVNGFLTSAASLALHCLSP